MTAGTATTLTTNDNNHDPSLLLLRSFEVAEIAPSALGVKALAELHRWDPPTRPLTTVGGRSSYTYVQETFDRDFASRSPHHAALLHRCSAIVGLHPDQATEAIVDVALATRTPFAVLPCCLFVDTKNTRVAVKTWDDFFGTSKVSRKSSSKGKFFITPLTLKRVWPIFTPSDTVLYNVLPGQKSVPLFSIFGAICPV